MMHLMESELRRRLSVRFKEMSVLLVLLLTQCTLVHAAEDLRWRYCTSELADAFESYQARVMTGAATLDDLTTMERDTATQQGDAWLKNHFELMKRYFGSITSKSYLVGKCTDSRAVLYIKIVDDDPRFSYVAVSAVRSGNAWKIYNASKETASVKESIEFVPSQERP
jgi:hypothetical protein